MKLMNEAAQVLRPGPVEDEDFKELVSQATSFRKILSQVKPSPKDAQNGTTLTWQANAKALVTYKVKMFSSQSRLLSVCLFFKI